MNKIPEILVVQLFKALIKANFTFHPSIKDKKIVSSSVTFIKSANQSSAKLCPKNDLHFTSLYKIHTFSSKQVMSILKLIR